MSDRSPHAIATVLPDGTIVRGQRWGAGPHGVLCLHEPSRDLDAWGSLPTLLASRLPLATLAYDLPGHGLSDDPWQPDQAPCLIRALVPDPAAAECRFVIAAGPIANVALALANELRLSGLVAFSPVAEDDAVPLPRSPAVPKLCFAGSLADDDLDIARRLMTTSGGWAVVTSVPVAERGTALLATAWSTRIVEQIEVFMRDCLAGRNRIPARAHTRPRAAG